LRLRDGSLASPTVYPTLPASTHVARTSRGRDGRGRTCASSLGQRDRRRPEPPSSSHRHRGSAWGESEARSHPVSHDHWKESEPQSAPGYGDGKTRHLDNRGTGEVCIYRCRSNPPRCCNRVSLADFYDPTADPAFWLNRLPGGYRWSRSCPDGARNGDHTHLPSPHGPGRWREASIAG
jgi:hypothetical protein